VFDVIVGPRSLFFYEFEVVLTKVTDAKVYMKKGSHSSGRNLSNWKLVFDGSVGQSGQGIFMKATMNFDSRFYAAAESTIAFYVSYGSAGAFIFAATGSTSNSDVTIKSGDILRQQKNNVLPPVLYSGYDFAESIKYDFAEMFSTETPSSAPSETPPSPTPSEPPSSSPTCSDRQGSWQIGRKTIPWCLWAKKKGPGEISERCTFRKLYVDCPRTCSNCISTLAPVEAPAVSTPVPSSSCSDRQGSWQIERKTIPWCLWAKKKGPGEISERCTFRKLYVDCPKTCSNCAPPDSF